MISTQCRKQWIVLLRDICASTTWKNRALQYSRCAERYAYANCQKRIVIEDDVVVCRYGDVDMLDIDFTQSHHDAAINMYNKLLRRCAWIVKECNLKYLDDTFSSFEALFAAEDDVLAEKTGHSKWEDDFYASQNFARSVLKGSGEKPKSGIFSCRRCKSFDVDTEQKQTRSADEPMTIFCTCNSCGKRFVH
jgi:hypothetical protein